MIKKLVILVVVSIGVLVAFMACKNAHDKSIKITPETFKEEMEGTWKSKDKLYRMKFYNDKDGTYRVSYFVKESLLEDEDNYFDYKFYELKRNDDDNYPYTLVLDAGKEGMKYDIDISTDGKKLECDLEGGIILYRR